MATVATSESTLRITSGTIPAGETPDEKFERQYLESKKRNPFDPWSYYKAEDQTHLVRKRENSFQATLTAIPDIGRYVSLVSLVITGHKLTALPPGIGELSQLTNLKVSHNELTELPVELTRLSKLQRLNLRVNKLSFLPGGFEKLSSLDTLDLSGNRFATFPTVIAKLAKVSYVFFIANPVKSIPPGLSPLNKMIISVSHKAEIPNEYGSILDKEPRHLFIFSRENDDPGHLAKTGFYEP